MDLLPDDATWPAVARLADADRALRKELQRCYGARAVDWFYASRHADPTMQGIADEYRAAKAACESLNKEKP